jgi:hypothetical protein
MASPYTHPQECADHKEAAADRKAHAKSLTRLEQQYQVRAHAEWFDWHETPAVAVTEHAVRRRDG